MRTLLTFALATALSAQGSAQGSGDRYNCTEAFLRRGPNAAMGFAITWGGARATRSVKVGVVLSMAAGLYKTIRDRRGGNDRASVGTNFSLHVAGTMIGAALAKHQLEPPEFAKAVPLAQPLEDQYLYFNGTVAGLIPIDCLQLGGSARVTEAITVATDWVVTLAGTTNILVPTITDMTLGKTDIGFINAFGTQTGGTIAADRFQIDTVGTPGAGKIRCTLFYLQLVAPTS